MIRNNQRNAGWRSTISLIFAAVQTLCRPSAARLGYFVGGEPASERPARNAASLQQAIKTSRQSPVLLPVPSVFDLEVFDGPLVDQICDKYTGGYKKSVTTKSLTPRCGLMMFGMRHTELLPTAALS